MRKVLRGGIYYADLNSSIGSVQSGIRPVLILQNEIYNNTSSTTIVAPLSRYRKSKVFRPSHIVIYRKDGLKHDSIVLLEQLRVIDKKQIKAYLTKIDDEIMHRVEFALLDTVEIDISKLCLFKWRS